MIYERSLALERGVGTLKVAELSLHSGESRLRSRALLLRRLQSPLQLLEGWLVYDHIWQT